MTTNIWPTLRYDDARAAIRFLVDVLGFTERAVYGEGDRVDHAELRWPAGGGVMLGSASRAESAIAELPAGTGSVYIVDPDPAVVYARVQAAGANITRELHDEDYGGSGFVCRDAEGVYWSVGSYAGTPD